MISTELLNISFQKLAIHQKQASFTNDIRSAHRIQLLKQQRNKIFKKQQQKQQQSIDGISIDKYLEEYDQILADLDNQENQEYDSKSTQMLFDSSNPWVEFMSKKKQNDYLIKERVERTVQLFKNQNFNYETYLQYKQELGILEKQKRDYSLIEREQNVEILVQAIASDISHEFLHFASQDLYNYFLYENDTVQTSLKYIYFLVDTIIHSNIHIKAINYLISYIQSQNILSSKHNMNQEQMLSYLRVVSCVSRGNLLHCKQLVDKQILQIIVDIINSMNLLKINKDQLEVISFMVGSLCVTSLDWMYFFLHNNVHNQLLYLISQLPFTLEYTRIYDYTCLSLSIFASEMIQVIDISHSPQQIEDEQLGEEQNQFRKKNNKKQEKLIQSEIQKNRRFVYKELEVPAFDYNKMGCFVDIQNNYKNEDIRYNSFNTYYLLLEGLLLDKNEDDMKLQILEKREEGQKYTNILNRKIENKNIIEEQIAKLKYYLSQVSQKSESQIVSEQEQLGEEEEDEEQLNIRKIQKKVDELLELKHKKELDILEFQSQRAEQELQLSQFFLLPFQKNEKANNNENQQEEMDLSYPQNEHPLDYTQSQKAWYLVSQCRACELIGPALFTDQQDIIILNLNQIRVLSNGNHKNANIIIMKSCGEYIIKCFKKYLLGSANKTIKRQTIKAVESLLQTNSNETRSYYFDNLINSIFQLLQRSKEDLIIISEIFQLFINTMDFLNQQQLNTLFFQDQFKVFALLKERIQRSKNDSDYLYYLLGFINKLLFKYQKSNNEENEKFKQIITRLFELDILEIIEALTIEQEDPSIFHLSKSIIEIYYHNNCQNFSLKNSSRANMF